MTDTALQQAAPFLAALACVATFLIGLYLGRHWGKDSEVGRRNEEEKRLFQRYNQKV